MREEKDRENEKTPRRVSKHSGTGRYGARDDGKRESIRGFEANDDFVNPAADESRTGKTVPPKGQSTQENTHSDPENGADMREKGKDSAAAGSARESGATEGTATGNGAAKKPPRHPAPKKPYKPVGDPDRFVHQIIPYAMFWVALFAAVSFILRDLCGMGDSAGAFGNKFADLLCGLLGAAAYLLPLFLVVLALRWKHFVETGLLVRKLVLSGAFLWLLSGIIHVFEDKAGRGVRVLDAATLYANGKARTGGGIVGGFLGEWMGFTLRLPGTCLLAIPLLIIIGIYLVGLTPRGLWQRISAKLHLGEKSRGSRGGKPTLAGKTANTGTLNAGENGGTLPATKDEWCEPQPLTRTQTPLHYDFTEEKRQPFHTAKPKQGEAARPTVSAEIAAAFGAENIVDIPDDELELPAQDKPVGGTKPNTAYSPFVPAAEQPGGKGYPTGNTAAPAAAATGFVRSDKTGTAYSPFVPNARDPEGAGTAEAPHPASSKPGTAYSPFAPSPARAEAATAAPKPATPANPASAQAPTATDCYSPFALPRMEELPERREGTVHRESVKPAPAGEQVPPEGYSPFGVRQAPPATQQSTQPAKDGNAVHSAPSTGYSPFGLHRDFAEEQPHAEGQGAKSAPAAPADNAPGNGFSPFGIHQDFTEGSIGNAGGQGAFGKADYGKKFAFPEEAPEPDVISDDDFGDDELFAGGAVREPEVASAAPAKKNPTPAKPDFAEPDDDIPAAVSFARPATAPSPEKAAAPAENAVRAAAFAAATLAADQPKEEKNPFADEQESAPRKTEPGAAMFRTAAKATVTEPDFTEEPARPAEPVTPHPAERNTTPPVQNTRPARDWGDDDDLPPVGGAVAARPARERTASPARNTMTRDSDAVDFHVEVPTFTARENVTARTETVKDPVRTKTEPVRQTPPAHTPAPARDFVIPPLTLLNEDHQNKNVDHTEEMEEKKAALRATLASFNVRIQEDIQCSRGPTITRYELRPEVGTSVRSVTNHIDDIALNMAAQVRIEAPIPGKPAIGIEVPNAERETVYMRTLLESAEYKNSKKPLEVPLGIGIGGNIQMCDLAKMPHLLVAGTTGSGKSVCINTILIGLMYKTTPADLRLILIDPKQVEFSLYEHVPHLYMPIVTDMKRAVGVLACAVAEMDRRYALMRDVGVREIDAYNEAVKNDPEREHLPKMVIVIDEFADLKMSVTNNDPETFTCRLAQKARAAGIHLIIGTQRPSVDVITGKLKANIPSRIAFTVMQQVDSRTILDANGAEALTGRGDMLYMPIGVQKPARVQGAFVSDGEIDRVVTYIREHNETVHYNEEFMNQLEVEMAKAEAANRKPGDDDFADDGESGEDAIFNKAVRLAVESQKVATSLLQRRLSIGYGRAAKLIDRMEEMGIVSPAEGNKPRRVLITAEQYAARMANEGGFTDDTDDYV